MKNKYKIALLALSICLSVAFLFGTSYALWTDTKTQTDENKIVAGCFSIEFEDSNLISLGNTYPMTDAEGLATTPYTMTVKNTCNIAAKMQIVMNVMNTTTMSAEKVALQVSGAKDISKTLVNTLTEVEPVGTKAAQATTAYEITTDTLKPEETKTYEFRIWIDEAAEEEVEGQTFESNIVIHSTATKITAYKDASGANEPELKNGMLPVVYQADKWVKADTNDKWYDYNEQMWANAVTVTETAREKYKDASSGTPIEEDEINTMWVWIPKFEYQYDNLSSSYAGGTQKEPGAININFIKSETVTPSADNFKVHDAFWWDDNNNGEKETNEYLSGIWVGKFETSSEETCDANTYGPNAGCDFLLTPKIIPNVTSWRNARIATYWTAIHNKMNAAEGEKLYGIINSDTHMMKNMEWGAVAFLSQSKYGKYGNTAYTGADKEVYQNKSADYITGYSNGTPSVEQIGTEQKAYNVEKEGTGASTTGNIYGIYDMSGGALEDVMSVMKASYDKNSNEPAVEDDNSGSRDSGFSGTCLDGSTHIGDYGSLKEKGSKYYDLYDRVDTQSYANIEAIHHSGDATWEVMGWYDDLVDISYYTYTYVVRGGYYYDTKTVGMFTQESSTGSGTPRASTRIVSILQP